MKEKPSPFCPDFCEFVKARSYECKKYSGCWHLQDKKLPPRDVEVTISGISHRVTIVGENDVRLHIWYLKEGALPQMLPKSYEAFSQVPEARTQKEIYDSNKKKERENRNKTHK